MNNFIFVQYTAGACGKAIGVCLQTASTVKSWQLPDISTVVKMHTNDHRHVRFEPDPSYKLKWLARTHGITRGDDLSREKVLQLLAEENLLDGGQLVIPWTKRDIPHWFSGKIVQINNDRNSIAWLRKRRKKLFYVPSKEGIIEVRYDSRYHTRPDRNDRCVNTMSLEDLVTMQINEETYPIRQDAYHIVLSDIIECKWSTILDTLEKVVESPLDRSWCIEYLTAWHKQIN